MQAFKVSGKFLMGRNRQPFTIEVATSDEINAREKVLSIMGSKHRANRRSITIEKIEAISPDEISDQTVEYQVKGKK